MNEFSAKKLGEVLAFAKVGQANLEKGQIALESVLGKENVSEFLSLVKEHQINLELLARKHACLDITLPKSIRTSEKLMKMCDLYVGDEWDNPVELLEWNGFFQGAAIVHWSLVLGVSKNVKDESLELLAHKAIKYHENFLKIVNDSLNQVGIKKSIA